jgi:hypothetical protein
MSRNVLFEVFGADFSEIVAGFAAVSVRAG